MELKQTKKETQMRKCQNKMKIIFKKKKIEKNKCRYLKNWNE